MSVQLENLSLLIIDPDSNRRRRLREVLNSSLYRASVKYARNLNDVSEAMRGERNVNFIFVPQSLGNERIGAVVRAAKGSTRGDATRVIVTLPAGQRGAGSAVVDMFLQGSDGFIAEPYSADEVMKLLAALHEKNAAPPTEEQAAVKVFKAAEFLARDATRHIDDLARAHAEGRTEGGPALRELRGVSASLNELYQRSSEQTIEALVRVFVDVPAPPPDLYPRRRKAVQKKARHPGIIIRELMAQRGLTPERILPVAKIDPAVFGEILDGRADLDDEIARGLARAFGGTSVEWMRRQREFDASKPPMPKVPPPG